MTILQAVENKKSSDYIRQLLDSSSDINHNINEKDKDGWTPLMFAADNNDYKTAKLFIEYGADLNIQNDDGQTALMISELEESEKIAILLIDSGADINIQDKWGQDALMIAADSNLKRVGEKLLLEGAKNLTLNKQKIPDLEPNIKEQYLTCFRNQKKPVYIPKSDLKDFGVSESDLRAINLLLKIHNLVLRPSSSSVENYILTFTESYAARVDFDNEVSLFLIKIFSDEDTWHSLSMKEIKKKFYDEYEIEINDNNIYTGQIKANDKLFDIQILKTHDNKLKSEFKNLSPADDKIISQSIAENQAKVWTPDGGFVLGKTGQMFRDNGRFGSYPYEDSCGDGDTTW